MPDLPELTRRGIALVRADNPGPKTLEGTNTWIVEHGKHAWVVDPGPALPDHLDAVAAAATAHGGLAGIALTHRHGDHADGVSGLLHRTGPAPIASASGWVPGDAPAGTTALVLSDGERAGPFDALATPGHAPDHLAFVAGDSAFVGDAVLGRGSVLLVPHPGALAGYLDALGRLRAHGPALLLPGHGPLVTDAPGKLDEYVAHRRGREARLVAALDAGARTTDELLAAAWDDVPDELRLAAAVTLAAHLDHLAEDGRLPEGVERMRFEAFDGL